MWLLHQLAVHKLWLLLLLLLMRVHRKSGIRHAARHMHQVLLRVEQVHRQTLLVLVLVAERRVLHMRRQHATHAVRPTRTTDA